LSLNADIGHRFKARSQKRKSVPGKDEWSVVGYSAAEAFDLFSLLEGTVTFVNKINMTRVKTTKR
jgi:hypothetical protein